MWRPLSAAVVGAALLAAAALRAQPSRVGCGPAAAGCGPTAAGVPGSTVTTTTIVSTAPSWVSSTFAAWMLDEASGVRANAKNPPTSNLSEFGGTIANNTVDKREGAASAEMVVSRMLSYAATPAAPLTFTIWARLGSGNTGIREIILNANASTGFALEYDGTATKYRVALNNPSSDILQAGTTTVAGPWTHLGFVRDATTTQLYLNGTLSAQKTNAFITSTFANMNFSMNTTAAFLGQLDEAGQFNIALSPQAMCRICSCGIRGEQCTCAGTAFASTGRNATDCGSCTLPADCSAAAPS